MNKFTQTLTLTLLLGVTLGHCENVLANETSPNGKQTYSAQGKRLESQSDLLLETIRRNKELGNSDQQMQESAIVSRDKYIALKKQQLPQKNSNQLLNKSSKALQHHAFSIYSAYIQLIEDLDHDGYYQTFSVTFDADVLSPHGDEYARVYAELYISEKDGPWVHYFTTDTFTIYGESTDDEYEVYSTLNQGFPSGEYDILIDLYEEGYSDIVATYSAEDDPALYAVPLESSDYDPVYTEIVVESHGHGGGSLSIFAIMSLAVLSCFRKKTSR